MGWSGMGDVVRLLTDLPFRWLRCEEMVRLILSPLFHMTSYLGIVMGGGAPWEAALQEYLVDDAKIGVHKGYIA
jgi:hypothetical protein